MFLNGAPVSAEELAPGFCAYDCWLPYQTYDVTAQLRPGENILGAWLGNGYYKGRVSWPGMEERRCIYGDENALIAELAVELENGETLLIPTDERWEASPAPLCGQRSMTARFSTAACGTVPGRFPQEKKPGRAYALQSWTRRCSRHGRICLSR